MTMKDQLNKFYVSKSIWWRMTFEFYEELNDFKCFVSRCAWHINNRRGKFKEYPYLTVYKSVGGWKAVLLDLFHDGEDKYEGPAQTGMFGHETIEEAAKSAIHWAQAEDIRYVAYVEVYKDPIPHYKTVWKWGPLRVRDLWVGNALYINDERFIAISKRRGAYFSIYIGEHFRLSWHNN